MHRSRHRRLRSHKLRAILIVAALIAGLGGATDLSYVSLKGRADQLQAQLTTQFQAAQQELEAGKDSLTQANSKHDLTLVAEATAHFVTAKQKFLAAGSLADNSRLLRDLELVPSVGDIARSRHIAISGIAGMGAAVSDAGQGLAALDAELIKPSTPPGPAGRTLLTVLDQTHSGLIKVRADFDRAQTAASHVDVRVVPPGQQATFVKARDTIAAALAGLDEFERLRPVLVEVLGGNGPRTYLVEQVNPAELRAGGGFIGSYSLLQADHGILKMMKYGDSYDLANPRPAQGQRGFIDQPDALREVIWWVSWSFVDSNLFPDFPSNAKAAEGFVQPRIAVKIDGVISIDYYSVARMLELTSPITLPSFGLTLDGNNLIPELFKREADPNHKALISAVAGTLMEHVTALPPERWPALLGAFNDLAAQRHLQAFFNNDAAQQVIQRFGWSGELNPAGTPDYMMEVESNYGGTKANYFLSRHYSLTLSRRGALLHHELVVDLVNQSPYNSYPNGLVYYRPYLRLYVPGTAELIGRNLRPAKYRGPDPPNGGQLLDGWLSDIQCCGGQDKAVFEFNTPWPIRDSGRHDIYWQKQPGTTSDKIDVIWNDGYGHTYRISGDLSQDRTVSLNPSGITLNNRQSSPASLPSLGLG